MLLSRMSILVEEATVSEGRIECHSPSTREHLGSVPISDAKAVRDAVRRARRAQARWRETSCKERRAVLASVLSRVLAESDRICECVMRDTGKTRENALTGEVWTVAAKLRWTLDQGERHLKPEAVSTGFLAHKRARLEFHPLGVLAAIVPWNYPFQNLANPIIPALFAGNAIVVKPSEWVAWSSDQLIGIFRDALSERGHDPDLVQLVHGYAETGQALIGAGIQGLTFIGSGKNGRRVLAEAAKHVVPVVLELGGKDPVVVCDDADLDCAVPGMLGGALINAGQNCVAAERIIANEAVYDDLLERIRREVGRLTQGPSSLDTVVDVGAMITPLQLDLVDGLVQRALAQGARLVCGGERALGSRGDFYKPTVLADLTSDMEIMQEEVFGPVLLVVKAADDAHAVELANSTPFGLGASVFSRDARRARSIASKIDSGMVGINDFGGLTYMAQGLTFGGVKESGFGRMNGRDGLRACCNVKSVIEDRFPFSVPAKVFPVKPGDYAAAKATVKLLYGNGIRQRWAGLRELTRALRS